MSVPAWGVRTRLTVLATAVTAAALVVAAVLLVLGFRAALLRSLDDSARQRGQEVSALVDAGRLPDPLPVTGAAVVQVLDEDGRVASSSPGGDRLSPLLDPDGVRAVRGGAAVELPGARVGSTDAFRVLGERAGQGGAQTVLVAVSLAEVQRGTALARTAVLVGVLVLLLVIALLVRRVSASALRPVERLRRGAEQVVAGSAQPQALPVPAADDEVAALARTLNEMLARLEASSSRQRAFVADAAHELRSPLASLRAQLEVALQVPGDTAAWREVAEGALVDVGRTTALVEDLLLLARSGAGAVPASDVDLGALAHERAGAGHRVPVRVEAEPGVVVRMAPTLAGRVVDNLLDNACRHAASEVLVRVHRDGLRAVLEVVDDGPGVAEADRERVFERFTRLDDARDREAGGTGLGLAIVRSVVGQLGGTVQALARADGGAGARFVVVLRAVTGPIG
ncbi:sensor histidine kinase [Angustibacter aerolatus]